MKINTKNVAAAVAVALMLSGAISSPALAAKKPIKIASSEIFVSCDVQLPSTPLPFLQTCEVVSGNRHAFVKNTGAGFIAKRGTETNPGVTIGTYATMNKGIAAAKAHIKTYTD